MKNILFGKAIVLSLLLGACSGKEEAPQQAAIKQVDYIALSEQQLNAMEIRFIKPEQKQITANVYLNGKVISLPNLKASVSANIEGKIDKIFVREGSIVSKGQTLMTLTSMALIELQNEYLTARSDADFQSIEFKRQEELIRNNVGALAEFQITEAKYNAAMSREKALRAKLALLGIDAATLRGPKNADISSSISVKAPIDGYVIGLPVQIGMLATPQSVLADIVDVNELYAEIFVYDKDIDLISEGQSVEIDFINQSFEHVTGKVMSISRSIDPDTKAIKVQVQFSAPKGALVMPGMSVRTIVLSKEGKVDAQTVPLSSILQEDEMTYVFATDNQKDAEGRIKIRKYKVQVGNKNESSAEIIFPNGTPANISIAQNNVMVLETQRKQMSGLGEN